MLTLTTMTYVKVSLHILRKTLLATTLRKKIAKLKKKNCAIMSFVIYIVAMQTLCLVREKSLLKLIQSRNLKSCKPKGYRK